MRLSKALRVTAGSTTSFTGAGGKSSALRTLAGEASAEARVLLTTTTHLGIEQADLAEAHIALPPASGMARVDAELARHRSLLVTGPRLEGELRWTSPGETQLNQLQQLARKSGAVLAIEADGSRGKSLKAPADHEPLVPNFTNTLVPVVGAASFGRPLSDDWVYRPELAAKLLGISFGMDLTPERVAKLVLSPVGGLKGRPPQAEGRVLINQVDNPGRLALAASCADLLLQADEVQAVILASLASADPVQQVLGRIGGVILAAGGSQRLGRPKLLEVWKGEPLLRYAVRAASAGGLRPIVVVLGDHAEEARQAIADLRVRSVFNQDWRAGQSASMRLGLNAIRNHVEAAVFLLGDMPLVDPALIQALVRAHASSLAPIVVPNAEGRRGNPVLFDRSTFSALVQVEGDKGGRAVFDQFDILTIKAEARGFFDLDTQQDLDWLKGQP